MTTTPQLKTRKPTGKVAYPLLIVDGFEKTGKSSKAFLLSSSPLVGRTFVCELGEPTADEYSALGDYEILVHDGTYRSMIGQLRAAVAAPMVDGKPNVIIFDSATALWDMLCVWTVERARETRAAKSILSNDPDAEVKPHSALYNDRADRFDTFVDLLRDFPGIAVVVCHGKEVTPFEGGAPVANAPKEYKIDVRPYLMKQANASVHCEGAAGNWRTTLSFARSTPKISANGIEWAVKVPKDGLTLDHPNPLEHVVFDVLKAGRQFQVSSAIKASTAELQTVRQAKNGVVDRLRGCFGDQAKAEGAAIWSKVVKEELDPDSSLPQNVWVKLCDLIAQRITDATTDSRPPDRPQKTSAPSVDQSPAETPRTPLSGPAAVTEPQPESAPAAARADQEISDELLTKPVNQMTTAESDRIAAELRGPNADDLMHRIEGLAPKTHNLGNRVGRLQGDTQIEFMKWLRDRFKCGPMAVPDNYLAMVTAELDRIDPPPPPFTDADCKLPKRGAVTAMDPKRKASPAEVKALNDAFTARGLIGPDKFKAAGRLVGRSVRTLTGLTFEEVQKCTDTLEGMDDSVEAVSLFASAAAS